jgi:hypothetical protein
MLNILMKVVNACLLVISAVDTAEVQLHGYNATWNCERMQTVRGFGMELYEVQILSNIEQMHMATLHRWLHFHRHPLADTSATVAEQLRVCRFDC